MDVAAPITVHVTKDHIGTGIPNDCLRCAVALALQDATGDPEAHVIVHGSFLGLAAWSRTLVAPARVRDFICEFDGYIDDDGPRGVPAPFDFELPPPLDPAWLGSCRGCNRPFTADELDAGYCESCRDVLGLFRPGVCPVA